MSIFSPRAWCLVVLTALVCAPQPAAGADFGSAYQDCLNAFNAQPANMRFCASETCSYRACIAAQQLGLTNGDIVIPGGRLTQVPAECSPYIDVMQRCIVEYLNHAIPTRRATDVSGVWTITQSNGYRGTLNLTQDATGHITGSASFNGGLTGSIQGTASGNVVKFTITYSPSLQGKYEGTISADGRTMSSGGTHSTTGESASWQATR